ncbi:MAG: alpha/beta hydrolase [Planctomycetaceae bacterium]|jgi:hypothetical protein|nr:alpha/beta hydrolase [Planctomycetaceae bacterium]
MMIRSLLACLLFGVATASAEPAVTPGSKTLPLPGEAFQLGRHDAFVILPPKATEDIPWIWFAPTLRGLPAKSEVWMFKRFLAKGIAIAGIDVGESFGSPTGTDLYIAFYDHLVKKRQLHEKPCLLARSRGGLMLYSWAVEHPQSVGGVAGIYPVCNIASYPGVARAASAYGLTAKQLKDELTKHNPIDRLKPLAEAGVPVFHIHGDSDKVVPLSLPKTRSELVMTVHVDHITAVCHDILEFSARALDAELRGYTVARFPFASSRERNTQ